MGSNTAEHRVATLGSIQIVHINGDRQGEIEHFLPGTLSFGRHPSCDIVFPHDMLNVSRLHARLECDQRQCRLIGLSGNGTYVNGELIEKANLTTGDVVTFSQHGPKLSFVFQANSASAESDNTEVLDRYNQDTTHILKSIKDITPVPGMAGSYVVDHQAKALNQTVDPEFTLQYANQLRSFKKRRIFVGRGSGSDFVIDHPRLLDQHLLLYFSGSHCFIANTTALKLIWLNQDLLHVDTRLRVNDIITLNTDGPRLIYKGEGKFQEYKASMPDPSSENELLPPTVRESSYHHDKDRTSLWRRLKSFFQS